MQPVDLLTIRTITDADTHILRDTLWPDWSVDHVAGMLHRARKMTEAGRGDSVVALHDELLCGYGQLTIWPRSAEISDLIIAPHWRNHGIGSAIVHHLCYRARILGATVVEIGATERNQGAIRLYERLGFTHNRELQLNVGNGLETVIYLTRPL